MYNAKNYKIIENYLISKMKLNLILRMRDLPTDKLKICQSANPHCSLNKEIFFTKSIIIDIIFKYILKLVYIVVICNKNIFEIFRLILLEKTYFIKLFK